MVEMWRQVAFLGARGVRMAVGADKLIDPNEVGALLTAFKNYSPDGRDAARQDVVRFFWLP